MSVGIKKNSCNEQESENKRILSPANSHCQQHWQKLQELSPLWHGVSSEGWIVTVDSVVRTPLW
jgi:hypothetical protein